MSFWRTCPPQWGGSEERAGGVTESIKMLNSL
jgi:hypothetical protein